MIKLFNIDPFQYVTLATVALTIYRSKFLPENTIAICDEIQYDTYSIKSIKWMKYLFLKNNINIKHACNGGEVKLRISGTILKVDGYDESTKTIYQFHGCYFHGCNTCFDSLTVNKLNQCRMKDLYINTQKIETLIKKAGFNLITIWEHEFDNNKDMKSISLDEYDLVEPAKIREAFFGGRTEPFKLIYNFETFNHIGKYIDVCSLYPTVMYYDKFPIGKPEIITKPKEYNNNWFGLMHCKVLPPKGLYLPVLPYKQKIKQGYKLLFGLCRSCMNKLNEKCIHFNTTKYNIKCSYNCSVKACEKCKFERKKAKDNCQQCYAIRNSNCNHSDKERSIIGFWSTIEIEKALEKGYRIEDIYVVHHFKNTTTELWKDYIKSFLKLKLESSAFGCSEEEYRMDAIHKYGIELEKLQYNPGLRYIAKLYLNSLWGKFGQNPKQIHKEYVDNIAGMNKIAINEKIDNIQICILTDAMVYVTYEEKNEFIRTSYSTNIYIACFTTALARIRLYSMLEKLEKDALYCDTDSVVYNETKEVHCLIKEFLGDGLGQWTDELAGKHIKYWCCAQAKDYGYIDNTNKYSGKVKGFRKNAETEEKMTNDQRIKLIKDTIGYQNNQNQLINDKVDIHYNQFVLKNNTVTTTHLIKQWAFKFDKRMIKHISDDYIDTLPYGY